MKSFLKTILRFLLLPIVIFIFAVVGYFIFDPFKALYSYDSYTHSHANRDYYGLENFKKRYPQQKYNSFIFGSSRTLAYRASSWVKHLDQDSHPYMMDGYGENIYGIYHKILYLDSLNVEIKNALIILDTDATLMNDEPLKNLFLFTKHPEISKKSMWSFQLENFEAYLNPNMVLRYYLYRFGGMKNEFIYTYLGNIRASVDSISNELRREDLEKQIKTDPNFFNRPVFYERIKGEVVVNKQITPHINEMLVDIAHVFEKQHTNYKIIIGPDYEMKKYAENDRLTLEKIFGKDHIYDFSGKNSFTELKTNYYENSHYRPMIGDSIMNYIYKK